MQAPETREVKLIAKISGTIERARGLNNTKLFSKSQPRCYVKGIKGNSHLVSFFCSDVGEGSSPTWGAAWEYDCLKVRCRDEFVGLKFVVYDGEEFLGGCDFDISEIPSYRTVSEELELTGVVLHTVKGQQPKKARLFITCAVDRKFVPILPRPQKDLMDSMRSLTRVTSICGRIVKAKGLCGRKGKTDKSRSLPMCIVRCYMNSGNVLHRAFFTKCAENAVEPHWDQQFEIDFDGEADQPLMLIFDIFGSAGIELNKQYPDSLAQSIIEAGDHLGTAMICVASIQDEEAFVEGKGRHKMPVLGDCQLLEHRLERDAGREDRERQAAELLAEEAAGKAKESRMGSVSSMVANMKGMKLSSLRGHKGKSKSTITADIFCEREKRVMPHSELLNESVVVEEMDNDPVADPELAVYFQSRRISDGERVKRLNVKSQERITSIYGRVNQATDLIGADVTGKSDPYVVVEALTTSGQFLFVYRTRYIKANLNPHWGEAFFWHVPPDAEYPNVPVAISKLQFSIYDDDESQVLESLAHHGNSEDDFLGRCAVDISFMQNSDFLNEDIPLLGVKAKPGGTKASTAGFRRYSTISCEVRVERRVVRIVDACHDFDADLLDCRRHHESRPMRPPEVKNYHDISQMVPENDTSDMEHTAGTVLGLREAKQLVQPDRKIKQQDGHKWLDARPLKPLTAPAATAPSRRPTQNLHSSLDWDDEPPGEVHITCRRPWMSSLGENLQKNLTLAQADIWKLDAVSRLPPMTRTGSVPALATRFGDNYAKFTMDPFEDRSLRAAKCHARLLPTDSRDGGAVMQSMKMKPSVFEYTARREIRTAP